MERDGLGFQYSKRHRHNHCITTEDTGTSCLCGAGVYLNTCVMNVCVCVQSDGAWALQLCSQNCLCKHALVTSTPSSAYHLCCTVQQWPQCKHALVISTLSSAYHLCCSAQQWPQCSAAHQVPWIGPQVAGHTRHAGPGGTLE